MSKRVKIALIIAAVAVAAYLAYRWYQNKQSASTSPESPTGGFGSNLNSVAPELVGGSTGPAVGPALSAPININLTEQVAPPPDTGGEDMLGTNAVSTNPMKRQSRAADMAGSQPVKTAMMMDNINPGESVPGEVAGQPEPKAKSGIAETETVPVSKPGSRYVTPVEMEK